jgi:transposase
MSAERIDMHRLQELVRLHRLGHGRRTIARLLGMSPNTERGYRDILAAQGVLDGDPKSLPELGSLQALIRAARPLPTPPPSSLEAFCAEISELQSRGKMPQAIYDELRQKYPELQGKRSALKRLCKRLKKAQGIRPEDVRIPVETSPGEVAQVDFGYVGMLYDPDSGVLRKSWVFVMVLGFSRKMFARIVFDQTVPTWLELHVRAFEALGGVPKVVVPDNLKAAVIRAAFGADRDAQSIQKSYRELARHYGFVIDPTPPRSPQKKGKVESGVKYLKRNFLLGSEFADAPEAQSRLEKWLDAVCNQRIHGTTGKRPEDLFVQQEKAALLALPETPFSIVLWHEATVHPDNHFIFKRRPYSAPFSLIGQKVWVRADAHTVSVYHNDTLVDIHDRKGTGPRSTKASHLPTEREPYRHRSRDFWQDRASWLGDDVRAYIAAVFDSDKEVSQLRAVQSIVTHLETFPKHRAQAACRRAHHFGCFTYKGIKLILRRALDLEPLPTGTPPLPSPSSCPPPLPLFARPIASLIPKKEDSHDWN